MNKEIVKFEREINSEIPKFIIDIFDIACEKIALFIGTEKLELLCDNVADSIDNWLNDNVPLYFGNVSYSKLNCKIPQSIIDIINKYDFVTILKTNTEQLVELHLKNEIKKYMISKMFEFRKARYGN